GRWASLRQQKRAPPVFFPKLQLLIHSAPTNSNFRFAGSKLVDKAKHRIAHVITNADAFGGAQRNTLLTLTGLVRDGYEAELVCGPGGRLIEEARTNGIPVYVVPDLIRQIHPVKDCRALFILSKLFRSRQYHIVHTHSTKGGVLGRLAAWLAQVPVIVHTVHGIPFEMNGDMKSRLYIGMEQVMGTVTDRLVCVGKELCREVGEWAIVPNEKLVTIYSGIDFSSYVAQRSALVVKRELGIEDAWPIVGCIGRLSQQKAQHYLLQAISLLKKDYPKIKLLLVGEGQLRPLLEKQIQALGLSTHIRLLGQRDDVADLLQVFDIYAMSSRWEGVGRALTEAMHCARPIVATAVNGVTELIIHEETGLCAPPHDPTALAAAINRLALDPELARRLASNAQRKAGDLMDARQMVLALEELYGRLTWANVVTRSREPIQARRTLD
ncbi:MAG: glycosyltransferase family 4 protein, partial [Candidatus Binatia bacterium]